MNAELLFRIEISRSIGSKNLLSWNDALNAYDSLCLRVLKGDQKAEMILSKITGM